MDRLWNHLTEVIPKSIHSMLFYGESDREYCVLSYLRSWQGLWVIMDNGPENRWKDVCNVIRKIRFALNCLPCLPMVDLNT